MAIQSAITALNKRMSLEIIKALKQMVKKRIDFAGGTYSALKSPRAGRSADTRLNDSGKFADNWVVVENATSKGFAIKANSQIHSHNITYNDILAYNDKNSTHVNKNIDVPPELTPSVESQVEKQKWFIDYVDELTRIINTESGDVKKTVEVKI